MVNKWWSLKSVSSEELSALTGLRSEVWGHRDERHSQRSFFSGRMESSGADGQQTWQQK